MEYKYFSKNGTILPVGEAIVSLENIEMQYGFGVYETLRVKNGSVCFIDDHIERLLSSASIIGLTHVFDASFVRNAITELAGKNEPDTYNIKILLLGGETASDATLYILCFNPRFPDKKLYRDGVACTTYDYERALPHAKTLNMLQSYMAYKNAKAAGAYDALLINRNGCITEGTRTNFFCIKDMTIYTPPEAEILLGVTRKAVLDLARGNGYDIVETNITPEDVQKYDGTFITSTSSKILPIKSIDGIQLSPAPDKLRKLMKLFDIFLETTGH